MKKRAQNGYGQKTSTVPPSGTYESGIFHYDHLKRDFIPTYTRFFDLTAKVPYLFNESTQIWISYDDAESVRSKTEYINIRHLRGVYFWDLSADREAELIGIAYDALTNRSYELPPSHRQRALR